MAIFAAGPNIGLLLVFAIGGWAGQFWGWRTAFLVAGLIGLVFAVPGLMLLREPRPPEARPRAWPFRATLSVLLASRSLRHLYAAATIYPAVTFAVVGIGLHGCAPDRDSTAIMVAQQVLPRSSQSAHRPPPTRDADKNWHPHRRSPSRWG